MKYLPAILLVLITLILIQCEDASVSTLRYAKNLISVDSTLLGDGTLTTPLGVNLDTIRSIVSDSLSSGGENYDDLVGLFGDSQGTDPTLIVFDDFENYEVDDIIENDVGSFQINVIGYDYDTQDDFTWASATIGVGATGFACNFGPIDVFLAADDAFILTILDDADAPSELEGYVYIEIRIYSEVIE